MNLEIEMHVHVFNIDYYLLENSKLHQLLGVHKMLRLKMDLLTTFGTALDQKDDFKYLGSA